MKAKIVEVVPDIEYKGTVYEQRVVVEFTDGTQIGLFDYDLHADQDMVGETKQLSIFAYIPSKVTINDGTPKIIPDANDPLDWKHHTYQGKVVRIEEDETVVLNVGYGDIQIDKDIHDVVESRIQEGQFLEVRVNRSDLVAII